MLALDRHIDVAGLRHERGIVVVLRILKVDKTALGKAYHPDPLQLGIVPGMVILFHATVNAAPAPYAPGEIEAVSPQCARLRSLRAYRKLSCRTS